MDINGNIQVLVHFQVFHCSLDILRNLVEKRLHTLKRKNRWETHQN